MTEGLKDKVRVYNSVDASICIIAWLWLGKQSD